MNKLDRLFLILLVLSTLHINLHAELLIVKKVDNVFVPLDSSDDKNGNVISDILLKYEWPMCIANDTLSDQEKNDLLSPHKPYAEELFIQEKIREAFPDESHQYSVIFIPTSLYELYCIEQALSWNPEETNPFVKAARATLRVSLKELNNLDLTGIIESGETAYAIRRKIDDIYKNCNRVFFYNNGNQSAFLYINNAITKEILDEYPEFKQSKNGLELSGKLKDKSTEIAESLIKKIEQIDRKNINNLYKDIIEYGDPDIIREHGGGPDTSDDIYKSMIPKLQKELSEYKIVSKVMVLEYEARDLNKALMLRGTSFEEIQIGIKPEQKNRLAGTSLHRSIKKPYSVAFGNSLFAGALADTNACVYYYLTRLKMGYALLINKNYYIEHQCSNLFFIPAIAPIVALFQAGEFFHSRTKAAIRLKSDAPIKIEGLWVEVEGVGRKGQKDPTGVILITRDPLRHAELFSKYISENGRIIQQGDPANLTVEERKFAEDVKESQSVASKFYKAIRTVIDRFKQKIKNRKESLILESSSK